MEFTKIIWENQPVLTTAQLTEAYKTKPKNISENFKRAKENFIAGVHYFKLTGELLRQFKLQSTKNGLAVHPAVTHLYLWTYQGAARHCKMINTPEAWAIFGELEKAYFAVHTVPQLGESTASVSLFEDDLQAQLNEAKKQLAASVARSGRLLKQISTDKSFDLAVVYCLLTSEGTVKIGYTSNLTERIKTIRIEYKLDVLDYYSTSFMSREDAARIEEELKTRYAECAMGGEFFDVKFTDVRKIISTAEPFA